MAAEAAPERIGVVCEDHRYSYGELLAKATSAARVFDQSGCEYVALLGENSEATAIALFGAALSGLPYVPLNYRLADEDLNALIDRIAPAYLIADEDRIATLTLAKDHRCVSRRHFIDSLLDGPRDSGPGEVVETVAAQIFTSGTTSTPKAAILRHENLLSYILGTVEFMSAGEDQAALVSVPPYHIAGVAAVLSSVYAMRRLVFLPAFSPERWLELVAEEQVTNAFVVPTMLARITDCLKSGAAHDLNSLRAIAYGGGRMPLELIEKVLQQFPQTDFTNAYGLTETSSTIALLSPADHRDALASHVPEVRARLASVGRPLPSIDLEIRDEHGNVLGPGQPGEIFVRGEQVSGEYRERSALLDDGWFPTRDHGYLDDEGYLFLGGRADDVIVRGGENISPKEIEDVLLDHESIADAAAVGIPSSEWGEAVAVAIATRPNQAAPSDEEICSLIKARLRSSRIPVAIKVVEALPYNEMGKLLRRDVRALF